MTGYDDTTWTTKFPPKIQTLLPLTIAQIALPIIPASFAVAASMILLFAYHQSQSTNINITLAMVFCLNFNGVILIIFSVYILVSKWISHMMNPDNRYIDGVSFQLLYDIFKPRLARMCGIGILSIVTGYVALLWACSMLFSNWILIIFIIPGAIIVWAFFELVKSEITKN